MEKFIIIPKGQEKPYQKVMLNWYTGIDAIETADGNFILNEEAVALLDKFPGFKVTIADKEVIAKDTLKAYPLKAAKDIIFKQEAERIEP
jgi:hypothetical protein